MLRKTETKRLEAMKTAGCKLNTGAATPAIWL